MKLKYILLLLYYFIDRQRKKVDHQYISQEK